MEDRLLLAHGSCQLQGRKQKQAAGAPDWSRRSSWLPGTNLLACEQYNMLKYAIGSVSHHRSFIKGKMSRAVCTR